MRDCCISLLGLAVSAWWMRDWLYQPDGVCGIGMVGCNSLGYRALFQGDVFTVLLAELLPAATSPTVTRLVPATSPAITRAACVKKGGVKLTHSALSDLLLERK